MGENLKINVSAQCWQETNDDDRDKPLSPLWLCPAYDNDPMATEKRRPSKFLQDSHETFGMTEMN